MKNMYVNVPCPNQGCRRGKIHTIIGYDIFWNDCPVCGGLGVIKRQVPDYISELQHQRRRHKRPL